jgi:beta-galactosidase
MVSDEPGLVLVALNECGLELQAPQMRTRTKRRIELRDVDADLLPSDSLRFTGWDPERMDAVFDDLDPSATYAIEAVYLCERGVERRQSMTAGDVELHPPLDLTPGRPTTVRVAVPPATYADGTLDVAVNRIVGPDAVMSVLRLYASVPPVPILTVVGDASGGLIGSVAGPDSTGHADAEVRVASAGGIVDVRTDSAGIFRVPVRAGPSRGQNTELTISARVGAREVEQTVDTRQVARGLRELPPEADRLDLGGDWAFGPGPYASAPAAVAAGDQVTTRVPGHVIFDGLVPDDGVATFQRAFEVPEAWSSRAVFLRCDGAYGRAEVRVNGVLAGIHGAGSTSFDVDVSAFLLPTGNVVAITLTEYTPYAVLDDMSWYAHLSLLGIWRETYLFATTKVHLDRLDLSTDWDAGRRTGSLDIGADLVNLDVVDHDYEVSLAVSDGDGTVLYRSSLLGTVRAGDSERLTFAADVPGVDPWSAEEPRLYDLEAVVAVVGGPSQAYRRRLGFRRIEIRDKQLLVNGAPIRICGVNRHDSRILKGRALSADDMRDDVLNLRHANVNVIRTSHYPPSPRLLDICDEVGMYVLEQPPVCFSGGFDDHHWTRTNEAAQLVPYLLEVTAETVQRDKGHCSIIVWDLGNESRWGAGFDAQLAMVRALDPSRPTIFSFDLNELGAENELVRKAPADRPDIRSYHYPGWDRTWQEDLAWLNSYDQPVILDEYAPLFAPCLRGPGEGFGLAIDPGIRDYWGAGYQPFMEAALQDRGVLGGLIWGGFGEVFVIPLDLTIGQGPWAHLPVTDYVRTHDHYPAEAGVFRRGDGDWGIFDAWNRPRPESWHVHEMYAPVRVSAARFDEGGERLELTLLNLFSHRSLAGLDIRLTGGQIEGESALGARPGETDSLIVRRTPAATVVRVELHHPEGWLVAAHESAWPGAGPTPQAAVIEQADQLRLDVSASGALSISSGDREWLADWPELHVLDVDMPHVPVVGPRVDRSRVATLGPGAVSVPLVGDDWRGSLSARVDGRTVVFDYECTYVGSRSFNAREVGLSLRPASELRDLWWRRVGEWSVYPPHHIGRNVGQAAGVPGSNGVLRPAPTWEEDATAAGSNDYRSIKRRILAAGLADGRSSLTVISDGTQHVRAELSSGTPVLHVLDWYGGVRTIEGNHPIWSAYMGFGRPITAGTELRGTVVLAGGRLPWT